MRTELRYGKNTLSLEIPAGFFVDIFEPKAVPPLPDPVAALHAALDAPLGCLALEARPAPASAAIALPDETRPFPIKSLLPPLLDRIFTAWPSLKPKNLAIVVGGGLHPQPDAAQLARILPVLPRGCRVVAHDAHSSPLSSFGTTSRGTPVEINKDFGDAHFKIVMGMVDAHQFVGFTGGSKGAVIGCASAAMIRANHGLMQDPAAVAGNVENNPVRLDLNEAGERVGIDLAVNVALDAAKKPVALTAGLPGLTLRETARITADLYGLRFEAPYDIVIASCGGDPKDICLYQAQKGLTSAAQCAAEGGRILLLAECGQGIGDEAYHNYAKSFSDDRALKAAFEAGPFAMGAHKAYLFARITTRFKVVVHSALDEATLASCLLRRGELQPTVDAWLRECVAPRIAVLKNANSSFFVHNPLAS